MTQDITQKPEQIGEVFGLAKADVMELAWANEKEARAQAMIALLQRDILDAQRVKVQTTARIQEAVSEGGKYIMCGPVDIVSCTTKRVRVPIGHEEKPSAAERA